MVLELYWERVKTGQLDRVVCLADTCRLCTIGDILCVRITRIVMHYIYIVDIYILIMNHGEEMLCSWM